MIELTQITRERMNGKPVFNVPAKSVLNFTSGFKHKLLCDGLTFTAGTSCAFSCTFCYVEDLMRKSPHSQNVRDQFTAESPGEPIPSHSEIIIRREGALNALRSTLSPRGKAKFANPNDNRVLYMSPLVDVAGNRTLCDETIEACKIILELTHWHIRILSKSNLLPRIALSLEQWRFGQEFNARGRMIYGVSTGTLDNDLAQSFETGTALVSRRIESLHWLQDNGFRTYGMICPSLPYRSPETYREFSREICEAIRVEKCEHVWAEVMNVRGESFTRTEAALSEAGYGEAASLLTAALDKGFWEEYSRRTFLAHAEFITGEKLRFLQYVTAKSRPWWKSQQDKGAVLL